MSQNKAQIDQLLTKATSAYIPKGYISEVLLPFIPVAQYTGLLGAWGQNHLRIVNSVVGGKGKYRRVETKATSSSSYHIEGHGLTDLVTREDYRNTTLPFNAEKMKTIGLSTVLWLEKEKGLADTLADTAIVTQNATLVGTDQFSDYNNSDPVAQFSVGREAVRAGCGVYPNAAFMDKAVRNKLKYHPQLLELLGFKYARPGGLSDQELAQALDVDKVVIADVSYQSANAGQTNGAMSAVWGKHMWMGVIPDAAQLEQISLGYRFGLEGEQPRKVYKQAVFNPPESTELLVEDLYDYLISNATAVYLWKNAIA